MNVVCFFYFEIDFVPDKSIQVLICAALPPISKNEIGGFFVLKFNVSNTEGLEWNINYKN